MEIVVDQDAKAVLEFMQANVTASRIVSIAESLPQMARLLWGDCPQEPLRVLQLQSPKAIEVDRSLPNAI